MKNINVNVPNFLIAGAPRCGTTSLASYLNKNDSVFMSPVKEPEFFSESFRVAHAGPGDKDGYIEKDKTFEEYMQLFKGSEKCAHIGEASVNYLYYHTIAVPNIKKYLSDPSIIILLRNPVDRAFSAYMHLRREGREAEPFERALKLEQERIRAGYAFNWHYTEVSKYFHQVKAYLDNFSKVHIWLYEDMEQSPARMLQEVYDFLGVAQGIMPMFHKYNMSGEPRSRKLHSVLQNKTFARAVKRVVPASLYPACGGIKYSLFRKNMKRSRLNPEIRAGLTLLFTQDIIRLQRLIGRDLSLWIGD